MTVVLIVLAIAIFSFTIALFMAIAIIKGFARGIRSEWPTIKRFMEENKR